MHIRLDKVGEEPTSWEETLKIEASSLERDELVGLGDVSWTGNIRREGGGFPLEAQARYEQVCSLRSIQSLFLRARILYRAGKAEIQTYRQFGFNAM